jgi:N-acetylneuraminic acid mutarotase
MKPGLLFLFLLVTVALCADADPRIEARKRLRESEVQRAGIDRALSKEMPEALAALPVFGTIDWTVKELPFIGRGPHEGLSGAGMAVVDGKIYLAGGFIPGGDETEDAGRRTSRWAHVYDPATDRWTRLPDLPERREYTRAIGSEKAFIILGGFVQGRPGLPGADVFSLDVSATEPEWKRLPLMSVPRSHLSVGIIGTHIVAAGGNRYDIAEKGYSAKTIQGLVERLDLDAPEKGWQPGAPIPGHPRGWCATAVVKERLYLLGGVTWTAEARLRLTECLSYDPTSDHWTRLADFPVPLSGWAADVFDRRYLIAVGGAARHWNDVPFVFDTETDRWLRIDSPLPPGGLFNDPGVCIIGDTLYVAGGEGAGGSHFNHFLIGKIRPHHQP